MLFKKKIYIFYIILIFNFSSSACWPSKFICYIYKLFDFIFSSPIIHCIDYSYNSVKIKRQELSDLKNKIKAGNILYDIYYKELVQKKNAFQKSIDYINKNIHDYMKHYEWREIKNHEKTIEHYNKLIRRYKMKLIREVNEIENLLGSAKNRNDKLDIVEGDDEGAIEIKKEMESFENQYEDRLKYIKEKIG